MTLDATPDCAGLVDIIVSAQKIVDDLTERPWGSSSPSVYETGRLVSLAPWLTGHGERLRFLLAEQRPDGGWGLPDDGYALVPTLSATEALLSALGADPFRMGPAGIPVADVAHAAARGWGCCRGGSPRGASSTCRTCPPSSTSFPTCSNGSTPGWTSGR